MIKKVIISIIAFLLLSVTGILIFMYTTHGEYYRTYSPDSQYSVYASKYRWNTYMPAMPGQGGDGSGKVYLFDEKEKKILHHAHIPMISMTEGIIWESDSAFFKGPNKPNLLDPWILPRPVKSAYSETKETDTGRVVSKYHAHGKLASTRID